MHEQKSELYAEKICYFLHVSGKVLSLIRVANGLMRNFEKHENMWIGAKRNADLFL